MLYRIAPIFLILIICSCGGAPEDNFASGEIAPDLEMENLDSLVFWDDVATVVFENCTPCHNNNGAAPFPLTEYIHLKKRTKTIRLAVADGYMPPWPADTEYSHFKDVKALKPLEKAKILAWIEQGAEEGVKNELSPTPTLVTPGTERIPDKVIPFPDSINIEGISRDKFQLAKIPFELPSDTFLDAIGFKAGNKQLVHHVNGHLINYAPGMKDDHWSGEWLLDAEEVSSLEAYRRMELQNDDGSYPPLLVSAFNYLPGVEPVRYPKGLGGMKIAEKGVFLLNTLHYGPSPVDTTDFSEIHLYYADRKPERPLRELHLGTQGISKIEPEFIIYADSICSFTTRYTIKEDISVLTINPHMHLLGTYFEAFAHANGDTIPLIRIPRWDFRWQFFYTYENPLKIPKGYEVVVNAVFDNTQDNPFNPFIPPKTLRESGEHMKTTDEMFQFFINYVPYREGDEKIAL
jgi:hypothetical protein